MQLGAGEFAAPIIEHIKVGRCRLIVAKPVLKASRASVLEARLS
jgi:hypothetical protein